MYDASLQNIILNCVNVHIHNIRMIQVDVGNLKIDFILHVRFSVFTKNMSKDRNSASTLREEHS